MRVGCFPMWVVIRRLRIAPRKKVRSAVSRSINSMGFRQRAGVLKATHGPSGQGASGSRPKVARAEREFAPSTIDAAKGHEWIVQDGGAIGRVGGASLQKGVEQARDGLRREV